MVIERFLERKGEFYCSLRLEPTQEILNILKTIEPEYESFEDDLKTVGFVWLYENEYFSFINILEAFFESIEFKDFETYEEFRGWA